MSWTWRRVVAFACLIFVALPFDPRFADSIVTALNAAAVVGWSLTLLSWMLAWAIPRSIHRLPATAKALPIWTCVVITFWLVAVAAHDDRSEPLTSPHRALCYILALSLPALLIRAVYDAVTRRRDRPRA